MNDFSPLNTWLRVSTWDSGHPKDDERFYKAVKQVIVKNDNRTISQEDVYRYIIDFNADNKNSARVEKLAEQYSERFAVVIDFLYENNIKL
ncbi:hypothetical protein ACMGGS_18665 [Superficieibacter sp. BNK-5]|uniref:hypothetical protein n=1 Tax=Superficieibacter sp. BNK-5 TaxID=3376142 RepID=UPI0039BF0536